MKINNNFSFEFIENLDDHISHFIKEEFKKHSIEKTGITGNIVPFGFLVKDGNKIVGVIFGKTFWGSLHIRDLIVSKDYRGKGLGTLLMNKAFEHGRAKGCKFANLETFGFQAKDFYLKRGFKIEFERKGYDAGGIFYYMGKPL